VLVVLVVLQQEATDLIQHLQLSLLLVVEDQVDLIQIKQEQLVVQVVAAASNLQFLEQVAQEPQTKVLQAEQQVAQFTEWVAAAVLEQSA
jgi:hypothetical protein